MRPGFDSWAGKIPWRRERLPTPVFWPGEFHGLYGPRGPKESDMTERLIFKRDKPNMVTKNIVSLTKKKSKLHIE